MLHLHVLLSLVDEKHNQLQVRLVYTLAVKAPSRFSDEVVAHRPVNNQSLHHTQVPRPTVAMHDVSLPYQHATLIGVTIQTLSESASFLECLRALAVVKYLYLHNHLQRLIPLVVEHSSRPKHSQFVLNMPVLEQATHHY